MTKTQLTVATLGFVASGILGAMVGGGIVAARPAFDYESCQVIVAKGDLATNPGVPDNWKEMVTTPGGNWCIR